MLNLLIITFIGLAAGILSGLFGIGGGVIIVPALTFFLSMQLKSACGISLAALLLPVGYFAARTYFKAKQLELIGSAVIASGLISGSYFGAVIAIGLESRLIVTFYAFFLIFVALRYIFSKTKEAPVHEILHNKYVRIAGFYVLGFIAGVLSGLFGIGGGVIIVPFLVSVLGLNPKKASGTSLGALLLPVGLPGVIQYYSAGLINFIYAAVIAGGLLSGGYLGAKIAVKTKSDTMKHLYGVFLIFVAIKMLLF
ncbi:MAG: hypothetical protein CSB55_08270 [Candidatus Cloacimonadota bacterium]|nr:MAG: hypothetical protein CSB55_08270 [Candidatus Cloacimonadota bacterium]